MKPEIIIYTDGGADPNPGLGGWAAILQSGGHEKVLTGSDPHSTNNRMELQATIAALQALKHPSIVTLHTDSKYVQQGITQWIQRWAANNWISKGGKAVANVDLWRTLWALTQQHEIDWQWVKGHAGNTLNERVDQLARQARLRLAAAPALATAGGHLYVRASCLGNPGPGGWGIILETADEARQMSGSAAKTTNNRMEIQAAIEGLSLVPVGATVQIITVSDYLFQAGSRWLAGWRQRDWKKKGGQPVANADLWSAFDQLARQRKVSWFNGKGAVPTGRAGQRLAQAAAMALAAAKTEAN